MNIDERGRTAADGIRRAVEVGSTGWPAQPIERFEHHRAHRERTRRVSAIAVAAAIMLAMVVFLARSIPLDTEPQPALPVPQGGSILFGRWPDGGGQPSWFMMHPDGSGEVDLHVTTDCAVWWPDGSRALTVERSSTSGHPLRPATFVPGSAGRELLDGVIDPRLNLGCGAVSPDATTLALEGFDEQRPERKGIYSVRASDGGGLVRLTHGQDVAPIYSPDGRQIAFTRDSGDAPNDVGAIYVMDADGSDQHRISPHVSASLGKAWSPDGRWIVFSDPVGVLYLVHPDGSELQLVPVSLPDGAGAFYPTWSPDGSTIAFSVQSYAGWDLYSVEPDGSGLRQITDTPGALESTPDWGEPPA